MILVVASMAAIADMWGIPNDLTPDPELMDRFLEEQVCPSLAVEAPFCHV